MENGGIVVVGAGGHCKVVLDSLCDEHFNRVTIVDAVLPSGSTFQGIAVAGDDKQASGLLHQGYSHYFVALLGNMKLRTTLIDLYESLGFQPTTIIHESATVSNWATLEEGVLVGPKAVVNAGAHVGKHATVNTGSIVEHDARIGSFAHVAPGSIVLGGASVGEQSFVGAGTVVFPQCSIGDECTIGAGSTVNRAIAHGVTAFGSPARPR